MPNKDMFQKTKKWFKTEEQLEQELSKLEQELNKKEMYRIELTEKRRKQLKNCVTQFAQ